MVPTPITDGQILLQQRTVSAVKSERFVVVDMLRGVAMILMALDHSSNFCGANLTAEAYGGVIPPLASTLHIMVGLLTNIASGIFFTLTGFSVVFFEASRRKRGWTEWQICRFFLIRAGLLLVLDQVIGIYGWHQGIHFDVLSAIAFCLAILAFVRLLPLRWITLIAVSLFFGYPFLVQLFPLNSGNPVANAIAFMVQYHDGTAPFIDFPALGRLSLVLGGYVLGRLLIERKFIISSRLIWVAAAGLIITFVLRLAGGYGNMVPFQPGSPLIYFFIESKDPPSVVFLFFNLSLSVGILVTLQLFQPRLAATWIGRILMIFGQTSLFFYTVHIFLYSRLIARIIPQTFLSNASLLRAFLECGLGLAILVPLCFGYRALKNRYPNSVFQYI